MLGTRVGFTSLLAFILLGATQPLNAQSLDVDCGQTCEDCGFFGSEGTGFKVGGTYKMDCANLSPTCTLCTPPAQRANSGKAIEALISSLKLGDEAAVKRALISNPHRVRFNASRNMLVLYGTKCKTDALSAVVFVDASRAALLQRAGVPLFANGVLASAP